MNCILDNRHIEVVWKITGFDSYAFGDDKQLYNTKTGRRKVMTIMGYTKGYWLGRKFYTLNKLRPLLYKPKNEISPF